MAGRITKLGDLRIEDHCPIGRSSVVSIWLTDPKHPTKDGILIGKDSPLYRMWPHVEEFSVHLRLRKPGCEDEYMVPHGVVVWAGRKLDPVPGTTVPGGWYLWRPTDECGEPIEERCEPHADEVPPVCFAKYGVMPLEARLAYYKEIDHHQKPVPYDDTRMGRTDVVLVARFHLAP